MIATSHRLIAAAAFVAGATVWACGSSGDGDLFLPGTDGGAEASSGTSGTSGGPGSSGTSGSSGGGTGDGDAAAHDGGGQPSPDGGVNPPNAGPGGDTSHLACGATTCALPGETCCVSQVSNGRAYACVAGASCPAGGGGGGGGDSTALKCSSAANCAAGTVCCVATRNGVASSECKKDCAAGAGGADTAQLCDPAKAGECPAGAPCSNDSIGDWGLPRTFATCGGQGN